MKSKISVNFLLEAILNGSDQNFIVRVVVDPRSQPVALGVFTSLVDVANAIDEFNVSLVNKSAESKDE